MLSKNGGSGSLGISSTEEIFFKKAKVTEKTNTTLTGCRKDEMFLMSR